jgi:AcrR family transcriptional regulator
VSAEQGRISKHPDVRREEILGAALELFMSVGYQKTSVQMITERVGVAKGLFYHYFDSKADLLNQVAMWQADEVVEKIPAVDAMEGDALDKLRTLIGMFVQWKLDDARELISTYIAVMYRPENAPLRIAVVQESLSRITPVFGEIIAEGVDEGVCDVDDPAIAAEMIFNLWTGASDRLAALLLGIPEHPDNIDEILDRVRAWESSVERLLGIEPGALRLYDYEFLEKGLLGLVDAEAAQNTIPPPAESA